MTYRIDPKTLRIIVSDLTPSIKGTLVNANKYADAMLFVLITMQNNLADMSMTLDNIETHLSKGSGEELKRGRKQ